ncbi:MAG: carbamoyl-phosphate synthase large subunit, partial [Vallitaleaceae bacterium]|nr:carbamoyl-phosphate synthase large subunit [Vallitaleaceae bacterium]
ELTAIDPWFLEKIMNIIRIEQRLAAENLTGELLSEAEKMGFTDKEIIELSGVEYEIVDAIRRAHGMYPVYKMVDTCAAEFESKTPYYYSTYETEEENVISKGEKIIVIGSGPIRIGQGIEFDYCSVHAVWAIQELGYESIIINNNPETVSTDFDTADKLYFEPLFIEDVYNVIRKEMPKGVIVQFGGQTAINLAPKLVSRGVQVLGTSVEAIDVAENRKRFERLLRELDIPQPRGKAVVSIEEAICAASEIGFPVLVRPSYVIGGRAMMIVYNDQELTSYIQEATDLSTEHPILVDEYIEGMEVEIDAICDREEILIPGIMEHIERTGVHSGDSFSVYPPQNISGKVTQTLIEYTRKISLALQVSGLVNIQFVVKDEKVSIIEVNPRASRTVPIISKVTKIPMVKIAMEVILGAKLKDLPYGIGLLPSTNLIAVKAPVFSFVKLHNVDAALTPEMKSTGEVLGIDCDYNKAMLKAFLGAGYQFKDSGKVLMTIAEKSKEESLTFAKELITLGFEIIATEGSYHYLKKNGIEVEMIDIQNISGIQEMMKKKEIAMMINIPTKGKDISKYGFKLRSLAEHLSVPSFTCLDTVKAYLGAMKTYRSEKIIDYDVIDYYM